MEEGVTPGFNNKPGLNTVRACTHIYCLLCNHLAPGQTWVKIRPASHTDTHVCDIVKSCTELTDFTVLLQVRLKYSHTDYPQQEKLSLNCSCTLSFKYIFNKCKCGVKGTPVCWWCSCLYFCGHEVEINPHIKINKKHKKQMPFAPCKKINKQGFSYLCLIHITNRFM